MNNEKFKMLSDSHQRVEFLKDFFSYLSKTNEDDWCTDICRIEGGKQKNCFIGHFVNFMEISDDEIASDAIDLLEGSIITSFIYYQVNDGKHPDYPQSNPKERCLNMVLDLISGKLSMTLEGMQQESLKFGNDNQIIDFGFKPDVNFASQFKNIQKDNRAQPSLSSKKLKP